MTTPMQIQYEKLKSQHPDAVLLFRLGDFYEAFNQDAKDISKILGITLTGRGKNEKRIPMAGIPHHALENYLPKIIAAGKKVAIADQLTEAQQGQIVERGVVKVHTPGTYVDEKNLSERKNHYISCLDINKNISDNDFYLSFLDLSTGNFFVEHHISFKSIVNTVNKINPAELLISESNKNISLEIFNTSIEYIYDDDFSIKRNYEILLDHFNVKTLKGFGFESTDKELNALGVLLRYVKDNQKTDLKHITKISKRNLSDYMNLDYSTVRNLELIENIRNEGEPYSLFEILDKCSTSMGKRMLRRWLVNPLINENRIIERQNSVDFFYKKNNLLEEMISFLSNILDVERLISKIGTGSVNGKDLIALKYSLIEISSIFKILENHQNSKEISKILELVDHDICLEIIKNIDISIDDDCPVKFDKGGIIKTGYSSEVDEIRKIKNTGKEYILNLQNQEKARTGIESLKIKFNKVFGYYIEVTKANVSKVPENYIRKQTLVNAERYITPELKEFEEKVLTAEEKLITLEIQIFGEIIDEISKSIDVILDVANAVALLDNYCNFAKLAIDRKYIKPIIIDSKLSIKLKGSRHPVVEVIRKHEYIPNDVNLSQNGNFIILTGPNMSGKSTYIRQVALNVLLAQIGSFVPCDSAEISIVDRIFTRVGASDNLASGESTFMVEMNETSNILNNATNKSLLILDEVGRGTSTYDGVAIAWSIVEYIHNNIKAPTLFATHYHELIKLEEKLAGVRNYHVHVEDKSDEVIFSHEIKKGGMSKSYGIHVAEMAGVPNEVIKNANEILSHFESTSKKIRTKNKKNSDKPENLQIELL